MKKSIYFLSSILLAFVIAGVGCSSNAVNKNLGKTDTSNTTSIQTKNDIKKDREPNTLDLNNQNLSSVPKYVFSSTELLELNLSNNNLSGSIPAEIRHLSKLRKLNLSHNQMTGVPAEIGQLSDLEELDLSNNKLTGLPYELGNLKKLRILDLRDNNYSVADLEIIKKGLNNTVEIKK